MGVRHGLPPSLSLPVSCWSLCSLLPTFASLHLVPLCKVYHSLKFLIVDFIDDDYIKPVNEAYDAIVAHRAGQRAQGAPSLHAIMAGEGGVGLTSPPPSGTVTAFLDS